MLRFKFFATIAIGLLAAMATLGSPARAVPLAIDLTISYAPSAAFPAGGLDGIAQFSWFDLSGTVLGPLGDKIDIGLLSPGKDFATSFIPTEPCVGPNACQLGFSFGGTAGGYPAFAFLVAPNNFPPGPPNLRLQGLYPPGPPGFPPGPPQIFSGPIFAFDDAERVGTWQVTVSAETPLPAAFPLFAAGLGAMGLAGWRRKRKAAVAC